MEVIDPRTLSPLDFQTIIHSVKKTKRLMVVDYDWPMGGIASEIISFVSENLAKINRAYQLI